MAIYSMNRFAKLNEAATISKDSFAKSLDKQKVDISAVNKLQDAYNCWIPSEIAKIVSSAKDGKFLENDVRILSLKEILNADDDLGVKFKSKGLIPIADCGDNDFAVYDIKDQTYCKFNIVDKSTFKKGKNCVFELFESAITEEAASQKDNGWKYKIPLTNKVLGDTEKKIGCKLPDDLKKFVIATNAATPENYNFTVGGKEKVYGATLSFDCGSDNGDTVCSAVEAIGNSKVIPFGVDSFGNFICYVIKDGSIVFWDHENGKFLKVAKNLHDFISSLHQA